MSSALKGSSIIKVFEDAGVQSVVALPDIVTCETVLWPISSHSSFMFIPVCKEDEGVSICASLSYCQHRAVLLMQHTGFLDSINAIRAIAVDYQLPIVMMVGLQGIEPDIKFTESKNTGIRSLVPICDALTLKHAEIKMESDALLVKDLINQAYESSSPCVIFISRPPV